MTADWKVRSPLGPSDPLRPVLFLAPMEGVSDFIFRDLASSLGGMDIAVTEFIRVSHRVLSRDVILRECPELSQGGRTRAGVPVLVQLLGGEPEYVAESAKIAADLGALGIDLNFGCPAKRVNGSDGGAALLKTPERITHVVEATRRRVPSNVTVSAKIRLGWENPDDVVRCAQAAEAGGADWITIHGRTRVQLYRPHADWARIQSAREAVRIPVVANGDIFSPSHLERCRAIVDTSSFMLGRGAFRTPNLFRWIRGADANAWSLGDSAPHIRTFVEAILASPRYDNPERAALNRVKGWLSAMSEASPEADELFQRVKRTQGIQDALALVDPESRPSFTHMRAQVVTSGELPITH